MVQLTQGENILYLNISNYNDDLGGITPSYNIILTDESTNNSKTFTLDISIAGGGWNGRTLKGLVTINDTVTEDVDEAEIFLKQPEFLEGFYQMEILEYLEHNYTVVGKNLAHLERVSGEDGYNRFESYSDSVNYKAYEE